MATATATGQKLGKVIQVIGPVIDVEFEAGYLPAVYNALRVVATLPEAREHPASARRGLPASQRLAQRCVPFP